MSYLKTALPVEGIGFGQVPIMMHLASRDGMSQDELARSIGVDRTTLNRTIRPLINHGYVQSRVNPEDRRAHIVILTGKGGNAVPVVRRCLDNWNDALLDGFNPEEKERFIEYLMRASGNAVDVLQKEGA